MPRYIILLLTALLLLVGGVTYAQDATGSVIGPAPWAPWSNFEGQKITLCHVVSDQRPTNIPVDCVFEADLTTTLDAEGNFTLNQVPVGWYLVFYEVQAEDLIQTYDEVLGLWDGKTIPIGDMSFPLTVGDPDGGILPSGCPVDQLDRCLAYTTITFYRPGSPIRLATDIGHDISQGGLTFATTEVRPGKTVRLGYGEVEEVNVDTDNDGTLDADDNCPADPNPDQADQDSDKVGDVCDLCSAEPGSLAVGGCPDTDADNVADSADNCPDIANSDQADGNQDGVGDACQDSDADTVMDANDFCPNEAGSISAKGCPDADGDEIADTLDACPNEAGLGTADGCPDSDQDGVMDSKDNCPEDKNGDQVDFNKDGIGDACQDSDADTVKDVRDVCPDVAGSPDADGCPDADGDKVGDQADACPAEAGTEATNGCPDQDGDQIADNSDNCPQTANLGQEDFNGDGIGDACQDSDFDGLLDVDDNCPAESGLAELSGCPDSDADTIEDNLDRCPHEAGISEFEGCPDPELLVLQTEDSIGVLSWNSDMTRILTFSHGTYGNGKVIVWDAQTGESLLSMDFPSGDVYDVRWRDNNSLIEAWNVNNDMIWDAQTGARVNPAYGAACRSNDTQWNADGSLALSLTNVLTVCDEHTGEVLQNIVGLSDAVWNPDGRRFLGWTYDGAIRVLDGVTGKEEHIFTMSLAPQETSGTPTNLVEAKWDPTGRYILGWNNAGAVIWDVENDSQLFTFSSGEDFVSGADWNPDASRVLTWTYQGNLQIWDIATGELFAEMLSPDQSEGRVWQALWNLDGSMILSWGGDWNGSYTYVHIWNSTNGELLTEYHLPARDDTVYAAWSPNGSARFITWSPNTPIQLWTPLDENPVLELDVQTYWVYWRHDGSQIAANTQYNTMTIWDVAGDDDGDQWRDPKDNCPFIANPDQTDSDGDQVGDLCDTCPTQVGEISLRGCPDADSDQVIDIEDQCPELAGVVDLAGCPDTDGDMVADSDDQCPELAGVVDLAGCPDTDGDMVVDSDDQCPELAGLVDLAGCPDADSDQVADPDDQCPELAGLVDLAGCPDADSDQVADPNDQCPELAGLVDLAGCPDADGDQVADPDDRCPELAGLVDLAGCPDADGDQVTDLDDQCPDVKGLPEINGCLFTGTVHDTVNLRETPSAQATILGQLGSGDEFLILGRTEASDWLRVRTIPAEDEKPIEAWLFAQLAVTEADINALPVVVE